MPLSVAFFSQDKHNNDTKNKLEHCFVNIIYQCVTWYGPNISFSMFNVAYSIFICTSRDRTYSFDKIKKIIVSFFLNSYLHLSLSPLLFLKHMHCALFGVRFFLSLSLQALVLCIRMCLHIFFCCCLILVFIAVVQFSLLKFSNALWHWTAMAAAAFRRDHSSLFSFCA